MVEKLSSREKRGEEIACFERFEGNANWWPCWQKKKKNDNQLESLGVLKTSVDMHINKNQEYRPWYQLQTISILEGQHPKRPHPPSRNDFHFSRDEKNKSCPTYLPRYDI